MDSGTNTSWWAAGVLYQIYPRSFQDSDGDGIGDLRGIIHRLPYLADLGVDAIWLSPIFPSPMADFGYDVSDHCDVDPIFGDLEAFAQHIEHARLHILRIEVATTTAVSATPAIAAAAV